MSIKLLTNTVFRDAVSVVNGDTSTTINTLGDGINLVSGGRHLSWLTDNADGRRISYVNRGGGLAADMCVVVGADRALTHTLTISYHNTYDGTYSGGSGATNIFTSTNFAETLVGYGSQDFVYEFAALSNKQAFSVVNAAGTGGAYTEQLTKFYIGSSFSLTYPKEVTFNPFWASVRVDEQHYLCEERAYFSFQNLTKAEIETFEGLYKVTEEPCFLYDSGGTWIPEKLYHGIVQDVIVQPQFNDFFELRFAMYQLRHYNC